MTRTITPRGHGLGWHPDLPGADDPRWRASTAEFMAPPPRVRLDETAAMPPLYDQGQLGSCTANALAGAVEYDLRVQGLTDFTPSRLQLYYAERAMEGTTGQDAGAQIRDGVSVLANTGVGPESLWPYDIAKFAQAPPAAEMAAAAKTKATDYGRVPRSVNSWKAALAAGRLVVLGFTVYESFEQDIGANGIMPMPRRGEQVLGGHAVAACGYDVLGGAPYWRVRNSWGAGWADGGYFWMPQHYVLSSALASDFWVLRAIS